MIIRDVIARSRTLWCPTQIHANTWCYGLHKHSDIINKQTRRTVKGNRDWVRDIDLQIAGHIRGELSAALPFHVMRKYILVTGPSESRWNSPNWHKIIREANRTTWHAVHSAVGKLVRISANLNDFHVDVANNRNGTATPIYSQSVRELLLNFSRVRALEWKHMARSNGSDHKYENSTICL